MGMRIRLQGSGHAARLLSDLNRCRVSRLLCDVVLQVGGRSFPAHRAVLACACTHFNSLFSKGLHPPATFSLDFVSAANFEKVLTFIYTGEIFTDLIDVRVLYELAERLGVRELVNACHATFPDLQSSSSGDPVPHREMESEGVPATTRAAWVCSSSAASCSSLSSSATHTPVNPSPVSHSRSGKSTQSTRGLLQSSKNEDLPAHMDYQLVADKLSSTEARPALTLQLKTEQEEQEVNGGSGLEDQILANGSTSAFGPHSVLEACSVPDSSAQLGGESCIPSSSSSDPLDCLQLSAITGATEKDGKFFEGDEEEDVRKRNQHQEDQSDCADQWPALSEDIIELSDEEEHFIVEDDDDEEEEMMCLEKNGNEAPLGPMECKACGVLLSAESHVIQAHAETHLSETGACLLCDASFADRGAAATHALTHVGILVFSCDICEQQFWTESALIYHRRQSAAKCAPQSPQYSSAATRRHGEELQCAVCAKLMANDFKAVREHVHTHVCLRTLSCSVCQLTLPSPCRLLWHTLTHLLSLHICPRCSSPFLEAAQLERHLAQHREEDEVPEKAEKTRYFLCPQTFPPDAFHQGKHTWSGKRKAEQLLDYSSSSSPPLESGSSSKHGFTLSTAFTLQDKALPRMNDPGLRQKWYRCRYCGKQFAHSGEFTYHLRIHTGEKPYQCKVCLRFFRGRSTMICHLKTHAGALMYRCTVCSLFFSTLKMVSSHMEIHKDHMPPDFNLEDTFMYNDHSKEAGPVLEV